MLYPKWTVFYNIVSLESSTWVGTGWEFFNLETEAEACYNRQIELGNCPTMRPYHPNDYAHLGAGHKINKEKS